MSHQSKTFKATWVGLQGRNIKLGKGTWSVSFHPCVYEVHMLWLCLWQRPVTRKTCHSCSDLQELKECAGRVFVDSQPEFCLPEVRPPITNVLICFVLFVLLWNNFSGKALVSWGKSFPLILATERTAGSVYYWCHPDLQLPLYDGAALHNRTHRLHWDCLRYWAHPADRQVRRYK